MGVDLFCGAHSGEFHPKLQLRIFFIKNIFSLFSYQRTLVKKNDLEKYDVAHLFCILLKQL